MLSALLIAVALLQDATPAPTATSAPARADSEPSLAPPPMQLAQWLHATQPLVVVAHVSHVSTVGLGTDVVQLSLESRVFLPGAAPREPLILLAHGGHSRKGQRGIYCLKPFKRGSRWELVERVLSDDADFDAKLDVLRSAVGLLRLPSRELRQAGAFELLVQNLARRDPWRQRWATDELEWLALAHQDVLVPARRQRLAVLAARIQDPELRARVETVAAQAANPRNP
ncbi:MAG: hypothetical protein DHS20C15_02060 [Planctomycetota bacterium]|nr:MAG: hypothetical protein DHS20C15_02060 [Planctomycetota bacterium]